MASLTQSQTTGALQDFRLPTNVKPIHYDLTIRTDLHASKFQGIVSVDLHVQEDTQAIVFNTCELIIENATIFSDATQTEQKLPCAIQAEHQRASLDLSTTLPAGSKARLTLSFRGELTDSMMGYYRSVSSGKGKTYTYSLTQFEPTAARRAFPCWDEPLSKATFAVTLISFTDTVNLSNMPIRSEIVIESGSSDVVGKEFSLDLYPQEPGSWRVTRFETSPLMSTYLVAFANGPFAFLESSYTSPLSGRERSLRVYATPDVVDQAHFVLDVTRKVVPLYEQVFDIEYPLPKLDTLVASDMDADAMENWGLITGRTIATLIDPKDSDMAAQKIVATTQCHEVAHMWFGNITTMKWWDTLYLNEGSLMGEVVILGMIFPDWRPHSAFISSFLSRALLLDAKLSSHPIEVECPDANMIGQIFDVLSYEKAAAVTDYVGEDHFLRGVSIYLKNHLYANSVTEDLWEGIHAATGLDIPRMMDDWVKKVGFPVVTVTETDAGIHIRQDRFLETGVVESKDNETIWSIPLFLPTTSQDGTVSVDTEILLDKREMTIELDTSRPFKLNAKTVGFYRVHYSTDRLRAIGRAAAQTPSPFSMEDRVGILNDAMALAKAGLMSVSSALYLIDDLRNEQEYLVLEAIAKNLAQIISTWWEHSDIVGPLNAFRRKLFAPIAQRLGYEYVNGENVDIRQLRTLAIVQAAVAGDESVVNELRKRFAYCMQTGDDSGIPADLENITYAIAVEYGGHREWEAVRQLVITPKNPSSSSSAMRAMCAARDERLAEETLQYALQEARDQDITYYFAGFEQSLRTRRFLAAAFQKHYEQLHAKYSSNFIFRTLLEVRYYSCNAFGPLASQEDFLSCSTFFKDKDTAKYEIALKQTLDGIQSQSVWIKVSSASG
ncbi:leucyl aminopeptidase [Wolfiporia cocos MD-104 SS10]|uniref:Aminopeptidase n=1 Tax=Wolfiporia cocos (strain MD-104) TaxID=742152 RepID=A0A2H3JQ36_WOLCO|nr:leucyl aminopeptidase [Wolfiporia cocos MD-104 SS10]